MFSFAVRTALLDNNLMRRLAVSLLLVTSAVAPAWACVAPCDGTVDPSWANSGSATVISENVGLGKLLPLADGKIVVVAVCALDASTVSVCATRLRQDGSLDASFGVGGHAILMQMPGVLHNLESVLPASPTGILLEAHDIAYSPAAIAPDGHIVIAAKGADHIWVVRLRADGKAIDAVLTDPLPESELRALLVQRDGKVVLVGHGNPLNQSYVTVARFLPDLSQHDASFGVSGVSFLDPPAGVLEAWFHDLAETADGALVLAGEAYIDDAAGPYYGSYVARLTSSGSYDNGFDGDGRWLDFYAYRYTHVVANRHGDIFLAGGGGGSLQDPVDLRVAGLRPDATIFSSDNYSTPTCGNGSDYAAGLGLQPDGDLLLVGQCVTGPEAQFIELFRLPFAAGTRPPFGTSGSTVFQPVALPAADGVGVGAGGILVSWYSVSASDKSRHVTRFKLDRIFRDSFDR